jgi:hypothetical protein
MCIDGVPAGDLTRKKKDLNNESSNESFGTKSGFDPLN